MNTAAHTHKLLYNPRSLARKALASPGESSGSLKAPKPAVSDRPGMEDLWFREPFEHLREKDREREREGGYRESRLELRD